MLFKVALEAPPVLKKRHKRWFDNRETQHQKGYGRYARSVTQKPVDYTVQNSPTDPGLRNPIIMRPDRNCCLLVVK